MNSSFSRRSSCSSFALRSRATPRRLALAMAACSLLTLPLALAQAQTLPTGMTVAAGQAQMSSNGNNLTVRNSPGAILNWDSFSIGAQNAVRFEQASAASKVLNRVTGSDPSRILGQLSSNGQVWLLNPNGVLFGAGARVDVAGLVTSTLALKDPDWLAGRFNFSAPTSSASAGAVVNQGEIRSSLGGQVLLLGGQVRNEGLIESPGGQVLLAAGQSIELIDTGAPNLTVKVSAPAGEALNLGTLSAAGGRIDVHAALVNQQGIVRADALSAGPGGEIVLQASERLNLAAGSVTSATAANGNGGQIKLLGREVGVFGTARIDASGGGAGNGGQVLLGGGQQGKDANVPNADALYFSRDASILADAGMLGDGGRVILWSDSATRAFGSLSAQAGAQGGNGGFIETSGGWLDARPLAVNVSAPRGQAGQWLLDPYSITISDAAVDNNYDASFAATGSPARINTASLVAALNAGTNVTVSTGAGPLSGDAIISVSNANILVNAAAPGSLTLRAYNDIFVGNSVISSSGGAMPVTLLTGDGGTSGVVQITASTINTAGGNVLIGGFATGVNPDGSIFANATPGSVVSAPGVNIEQSSVINAGSGNIEVNAANFANGLVLDTGAQLRASNILLRGYSSSSDGVKIGQATVTATHSLTIQGRGANEGVGTTDGARLEVAPTAIDTTASLTVTGRSDNGASGVSINSFSSQPEKQLVVSKGATLTVSGDNDPGEGPAVSILGAYYSVSPLLYSDVDGGLVTVRVVGNGESIQISDAGIGTVSAGLNVVAGGQLYLSNAPITIGGKVDLRAGEITLDTGTVVSSSSNAGGDAIVLRGVTGGLSFLYNTAGAGSLVTTAPDARWIIYTDSFTNANDFNANGLAYDFKRYGAASPTAWAADVGNGFVSPTPQTATFSATAANKVYDGTATATLRTASARGDVNSSDIGSLSSAALPAFDSKNVGTAKPISFLSVEPFDFRDTNSKPVYGYTLVGSVSANITPAPLTAAVTAAGKVYDATRTGTVTVGALSGLAGNETININAAGLFADKNVGAGKTVSVQYQLVDGGTGDLASNYSFVAPTAPPTASITPLAVTVSGLSAGNKVYDTTRAVSLTGTATVTALASDQIIVSGTPSAAFSDKNVGTAKPVLVQGYALTGSDAGNYTLNVPTLLADISPVTLSVSGLRAVDKIYDATTAAALNGTASLSAALGTDQVVLAGTGAATFVDKNVGTQKAVGVQGLSLAGSDAGNYILAPLGLSANITPASLVVSGLAAGNKVYNATTVAALTGTAALATVLGNDQVVLAGTGVAAFADKNVGSAKPVSLSGYSLGGADAGNYTLAPTTGLSADITPATLVVSGLAASNRVYNATTVAALTGTAALATVLGSDQVTLAGTGTAAFADKNVGTAKAVSLSGYSLGGTDAGNYTLAPTTGLSADITPATLVVSGLAASNKVYNATTVAALTGTAALTTVLGNDQVALAGTGVAAFADKNVGTAKPVSLTGYSLGGIDAGNYTLAPTAGLSASITPATLVVSGLAASNKVYDATTAAALTGTAGLATVLGNDQVTLAGSGAAVFADKNVGTQKAVGVQGFSLAGSDAGNYVLVPLGLSASITPATLTYTADPAVRTAGGSFGSFSGSVSGFVGGETLSSASTGTTRFTTTATEDSPAGFYAIDGGGLAAQNYVFAQAAGNARALALTGLPAELPPNGGSDTSVNTALLNLSVIRITSEPASGGLADLSGASLSSTSATAATGSPRASFGSVSLASMSPQALQNMLDARDRYKKALFADSISKLEQDPALADLRPCANLQEAEVGTCLVTDQLKAQLRDSAATEVARAPSPAAPPAVPPVAAPAVATPPSVIAAPAPVVVAAATPSQLDWISIRRKVRSAALPSIERKVALVIGVDNYADPSIPKLGNAVRDAEAVGEVFEAGLGYETLVLANASKQEVVAALNRLALELNPRDSVMIYYAGHGELVEATQLGYWQLADSDAKRPETWLSNADISRLVSRIGASQVALISDSCYSGSLVNEARIRAAPGQVDPVELLSRKSVVVMSSGGNEPVFDNGKQGHSPFAWNLMNTLQKVSNWQAGGQVFERVRFAVARELPQRPQYGASSVGGHQPGGDYLFEQRQLESRR